MPWMLVGYMFLFIHRPFEVWPALEGLYIERLYVAVMTMIWLVSPKCWMPNAQHSAYAGFAMAVLGAWALSPWSDKGQPVVEDWLKIVVFYIFLVTSVNDERGLRILVFGFMAVMAIYLTHSFKEYLGGRHTYRMGIVRMIGVDTSLSDPNSFGASIVFALPFVPALWPHVGKLGKLALTGYFGLSSLCILLTGSRSSLLGLITFCLLLSFSIRRSWLMVVMLGLLSPGIFLALPSSLQNRFETIINPEADSEISRESGQGRIDGFFTGLELWAANPLSGVGPGAWRPATGSKIESHNLIGQLVGETGTLGALAFAAILWCFWRNRRIMRAHSDAGFAHSVAQAVGQAVLLLLVMGLFGHNLFRFTWLWYGGFLIIARYVSETTLSYESDGSQDIETVESPPWQ